MVRYIVPHVFLFNIYFLSSLMVSASYAQTADPFAGFNKRIFRFNSLVDQQLIRPIAIGYREYSPNSLQRGVKNFFSNLTDVSNLANDLLQLKMRNAFFDVCRLAINTTAGLGGVFDPASDIGCKKNQEDFGQTLGRWGVPPGPYIVLPGFGSSSLRDAFGLGLNFFVNPIRWQSDDLVALELFLLNEIDNRSSLLDLEGMVMIDEYLFVREAYVQRREFLVKDGASENSFEGF